MKNLRRQTLDSRFRYLLKVIVLLTSVIWYLTSNVPAHAQEVSLVVSPPRYDLAVKPGETIQKTVKVTNNSPDQPLIIKAFVKDFIVQDDSGTPLPVSESASGRYLASPWFTLSAAELTIPPKGMVEVPVLVSVPDNALPGGHYAGVFFQPVPARGLKTTVAYTATQVGSLFDLTIAGDLKYDAVITAFSVPQTVSEFGPIDFAATIENQSDTHISPVATVTIHDLIGRQLAQFPLDSVNIFPFTSRTVRGSWNQVWGLGRYRATVSAAYGPGLVASRTLFFWILPYRLIAAVLVVLLVLLVLFILIRRHLKSRHDRRDDEIDALKRKIVEMENQQR